MNQNSKKTLAIIFFACQLLLNLILLLFRGDEIVGAIASSIGSSVFALATFFLLYFGKIGKIGTIVGATLQVVSCMGTNASYYLALEYKNWFAHGSLAGILTNIPLIISFLFLYYGVVSEKNSEKKETILFSAPEQNDSVNNHREDNRDINAMKQGHYDFSISNEQVKKRYRQLFSVPDGEEIVSIGDIKSKGISLTLWVVTFGYWAVLALVCWLTYGKYSRESSYAIINKGYPIRMLGIEFATEKRGNFELHGGLVLLIFVILLLASIPFIIIGVKKFWISSTRLMLTNKRIFFLDSDERKCSIKLGNIQCLDCVSCLFSYNAHKIIITTVSGEKTTICGVRNAHDFIKSTIGAIENIRENKIENNIGGN